MPNDSASRPSTCTIPSSRSTSSLSRGLPSGVLAVDHLGAHCIRRDILDDNAEHAQEGAEAVEVLQRRERQPAAGRARQQQQARRDEGRPDENVGAALRAEDRHRVDELAEHHLYRPRQCEPDAELSEIGGAQRQCLLHPKTFSNRDQA